MAHEKKLNWFSQWLQDGIDHDRRVEQERTGLKSRIPPERLAELDKQTRQQHIFGFSLILFSMSILIIPVMIMTFPNFFCQISQGKPPLCQAAYSERKKPSLSSAAGSSPCPRSPS